jgi:putative transcriptional regulator
MKSTPKSRLMEAVHETAQELYDSGAIDKVTMHKFDSLCLKPVVDYDGEKIKSLRERLNLSQSVLAAVLNTSLSSVRQWEQGLKKPSGTAQKLISLLDHKGLEALAY